MDNSPNKQRKRLTWKGAFLFLAVWALLVVEILSYGEVPETTEGWVVLVFLGPIGYIALAAFFDLTFGSAKKRKTNAKNDRPVA